MASRPGPQGAQRPRTRKRRGSMITQSDNPRWPYDRGRSFLACPPCRAGSVPQGRTPGACAAGCGGADEPTVARGHLKDLHDLVPVPIGHPQLGRCVAPGRVTSQPSSIRHARSVGGQARAPAIRGTLSAALQDSTSATRPPDPPRPPKDQRGAALARQARLASLARWQADPARREHSDRGHGNGAAA